MREYLLSFDLPNDHTPALVMIQLQLNPFSDLVPLISSITHPCISQTLAAMP